jgi:lipopolysaccharide transport system ATP-binding protein
VAAHLEPEILVVDEVLAVGDATFQKKCLGKMRDASIDGRTVLFVSHDMVAVESLCNRCILLVGGGLRSEGNTDEIISHYLSIDIGSDSGCQNLTSHPRRLQGSIPIMTAVSLFSEGDEETRSLRMGSPLAIQVIFHNPSSPVRPAVGVVIKNSHGVPVFGFNNRIQDADRFSKPMRHGTVMCRFQDLPLMPGTYFVDLYFGDQHNVSHDMDIVQEAVSFEVLPSDLLGTGKLPPQGAGSIFWPGVWTLQNGSMLK